MKFTAKTNMQSGPSDTWSDYVKKNLYYVLSTLNFCKAKRCYLWWLEFRKEIQFEDMDEVLVYLLDNLRERYPEIGGIYWKAYGQNTKTWKVYFLLGDTKEDRLPVKFFTGENGNYPISMFVDEPFHYAKETNKTILFKLPGVDWTDCVLKGQSFKPDADGWLTQRMIDVAMKSTFLKMQHL